MSSFESGTTAREQSASVYEVVFTPVTQRPEYQEEPIKSKLAELKEAMGEEDFNRYIESLLRITLQRVVRYGSLPNKNCTILEGKYLPLIAKIFGVAAPRIFSRA